MYSIGTGKVETYTIDRTIRGGLDRTGKDLVAMPIIAYLPKECGDITTIRPDEQGKVIIDQHAVLQITLGKDKPGPGPLGGVHVRSITWEGLGK